VTRPHLALTPDLPIQVAQHFKHLFNLKTRPL